jgi:hypothetical protein
VVKLASFVAVCAPGHSRLSATGTVGNRSDRAARYQRDDGHVQYAFHFVDSGAGWRPYDRRFFRAVLQLPRRPHILIRRGNVTHWDFGKTTEQIVLNARAVLEAANSSISIEDYLEMIRTTKPYVMLVRGMTATEAAETTRRLDVADDFVGVVGLRFDDPLHWAVYGSGLLHSYRLIGDELRLQHHPEDEDQDTKDVAARDYWRRSGLFSEVTWENIGIRATIFDTFDTAEHASVVAETETLLEDLLDSVAAEVMLRATDLDPHLVEALHAALNGLRRARTSEQLAQCALSCRRFMERLADRMFRPLCRALAANSGQPSGETACGRTRRTLSEPPQPRRWTPPWRT